jgi:DNA-binding MarR family transcriptional regulator
LIPIGRFPFVYEAAPERIISTPSDKRHDPEKIKRLLARTPVIRNGCDLDLLVFLYRHPRTLLTSEQIAAFVGRDMKLVAQALDALIVAGFVERLHNPTHAARLYLLAVHGPEDKGLKTLLELAFTRQGRHEILAILNSSQSRNEQRTVRLGLVKSVCA